MIDRPRPFSAALSRSRGRAWLSEKVEAANVDFKSATVPICLPFAFFPHRAEPIRHRGLKPDQALAPLGGLGLVAHGPDRKRPGYRLER